jgi:hypothetical protein
MTKTTQVLIAIIAILALFAGGLMIYSGHEKKLYLIDKGKAQVLAKEYADYKASAEPQIVALTTASAKAKADKEAALAAAVVAENAKAAIQSALDAEKAKTHALPPDALSGAINTRIGANQSWPTEGGVFTFTRPGTESVLNRFLNGEASESKYQAEAVVTVNLRAAIDAAERGTASISGQLALTAGERDKAIAAWGATGDALKHMERAQFGLGLKHYVIGAGVGAAVLVILHVFKVI